MADNNDNFNKSKENSEDGSIHEEPTGKELSETAVNKIIYTDEKDQEQEGKQMYKSKRDPIHFQT